MQLAVPSPASPRPSPYPGCRCAALNEDLVAWWLYVPAWCSGGTRWVTLRGGAHGTLSAMIPFATPASGWGTTTRAGGWGEVRFDGTDDYVSMGTVPPLASRSFSVSLWARRLSFGTRACLFSQGVPNTNQGFTFEIDTTSTLLTSFYGTNLSSAASWTDTGWHHYVFTWFLPTTTRTLYRDGIAVATGTAASYTGAGNTTIGKRQFDVGEPNHWNGAIDDVRVWYRALTDQEVEALYVRSATGSSAELQWLPLWVAGAPSGGTVRGLTALLLGRQYDPDQSTHYGPSASPPASPGRVPRRRASPHDRACAHDEPQRRQ